jgi:hypothetical protein
MTGISIFSTIGSSNGGMKLLKSGETNKILLYPRC